MAVVDYFLKLDGIQGESHDDKHKNEIDVLGWSWSEQQSGSGTTGGFGAGKVHMGDFHFTMIANLATPKLALACATGEHLKMAVLTCRKAGKDQQPYLTITLEEVLV